MWSIFIFMTVFEKGFFFKYYEKSSFGIIIVKQAEPSICKFHNDI